MVLCLTVGSLASLTFNFNSALAVVEERKTVIFIFILVTTSVAVVLCGLAFPIWILGIPGNPDAGEFDRGWEMGLGVIVTYPMVWVVNYIPYFMMNDRLNQRSCQCWQMIASVIPGGSLLIAGLRMLQAFRIM